MLTRREMLTATAALAGGAALLGPREILKGAPEDGPPGEAGRDYQPVIVPNGTKLPWRIIDGVKVGHMVAQEVEHEFAPGLTAICWGYNGTVHGPLIEAVEGDRLRIYATNRLKTPMTIHWHGVLLPNGMDGVGGLTQKSIAPGETFKYEFALRQNGTCMYHAHHDEMTQIALGMTGMFIIHPRKEMGARVDRDFAIMLQEWYVKPGARRPDPNVMNDFNVFTMNGKSFPATEPLVAQTGQRVRIRLGNLGPMDHHPIHLHGYQFRVTATDAGEIAETARVAQTTVLVPTGSTRTVEFVADNPGDWAMHCHMTHHAMNQMGHDIPNMIGVEPGDLDRKMQGLVPGYMTMGQEGMADMGKMGMAVPANSIPMVGGPGKYDYITMGGMFTILKVRDRLQKEGDPGWYEAPEGTRAVRATAAEMARDGIGE